MAPLYKAAGQFGDVLGMENVGKANDVSYKPLLLFFLPLMTASDQYFTNLSSCMVLFFIHSMLLLPSHCMMVLFSYGIVILTYYLGVGLTYICSIINPVFLKREHGFWGTQFTPLNPRTWLCIRQ